MFFAFIDINEDDCWNMTLANLKLWRKKETNNYGKAQKAV